MDADEALWRRFLAGEEGAFEALVTRYEASVRALAFGVLRDEALAEDVAQETFLRAYREARRLRDPSAVRGWIHRIALRRAVDELRRRSRRAELSLDDVPPAAGAGTGAAERATAGREIAAALAALSDEERAAVVLRDVQGMSYREIAETMGWPLGTVLSRVHRARERLRAWLGAPGEGGGR